jgi:hypothetical protein
MILIILLGTSIIGSPFMSIKEEFISSKSTRNEIFDSFHHHFSITSASLQTN